MQYAKRLSTFLVATAVGSFSLVASAAPSTPTDHEQYILQLINRARANPDAEVSRLAAQTWGDNPASGTAFPRPQTPNLNEGLAPGTISSAAKQPLAFNLDLITSARSYSETLLNANSGLDHNFNGTTPSSRAGAQGYTGDSGVGENLSIDVRGSTSTATLGTVSQGLHNQLFVDGDINGRGHRTTLMNPNWNEAGLGLATSNNYTGFGPNFPKAFLLTENFATRAAAGPFLTGAIFSDNVTADNFYTAGEGIGSVSIQATPVGGGATLTTTTWSSGGYTLPVTANTSYNVNAVGSFGTIAIGTNVAVGTQNVALNLNVVPEPTTTLAAAGALALLGRRRTIRV